MRLLDFDLGCELNKKLPVNWYTEMPYDFNVHATSNISFVRGSSVQHNFRFIFIIFICLPVEIYRKRKRR